MTITSKLHSNNCRNYGLSECHISRRKHPTRKLLNVSPRLRSAGLARSEDAEDGAERRIAVDRSAVLLHVGQPHQDVADVGPDDLDVLQGFEDFAVRPPDASVDLL